MLKPSDLLKNTAPQTRLSTVEFLTWMKDMTAYIEKGLEIDRDDFNDFQTLSDWLEEIKYMV
jgi:hypothetical protein